MTEHQFGSPSAFPAQAVLRYHCFYRCELAKAVHSISSLFVALAQKTLLQLEVAAIHAALVSRPSESSWCGSLCCAVKESRMRRCVLGVAWDGVLSEPRVSAVHNGGRQEQTPQYNSGLQESGFNLCNGSRLGLQPGARIAM
jgi:hypothetical protein